MARTKKAPKIDPSPMSLWFQIGDNTITDSKVTYIDLAQCLSNINRRVYRQGMNYAVAGFRIGYAGSRATPVDIAIQTLPTTWPVGASWHKFFAAWQNQQNEALDEVGSRDLKARWNDFKIYFDVGHKGLGSETPTTPGGFVLPGQVPHNMGSWEYSEIVVPQEDGTADEFSLWMLGASAAGGKGIIEHYGLSRNYPQTPDPAQGVVSTSVLSQMAMVPPVSQEEVVENATERNDDIPYNQTVYIGALNTTGSLGYLHQEVTMTNLATSQYTNVPGCQVPCGLIKIVHNGPAGGSAEDLVLQVLLVPGYYKGVLATPMQEMN